jgi:ATP-dependent Clp protease ATP-binding subunit ClpA
MATYGSTQVRSQQSTADKFNQLLVGQPTVAETILPFVEMFEAGLSPEGRPAGVFLLLGPTGTGKTRSVQALAEAIHGSKRHVLHVDCGEYQVDHEVAKLVGAPPGYLGHRETQPLLSQARINSVASERSSLSILLFDEIEKAAPSMMRMLLGILDRGILRLGDNNIANLERTMIFMTSNLGAEKMNRSFNEGLGFGGVKSDAQAREDSPQLKKIGVTAAKKVFSPEFMNRIDSSITYQRLDDKAMEKILDLELAALQTHLDLRRGARSFNLGVTPKLKKFLLEKGTSPEYGAREIKRTIQRYIVQPLAGVILENRTSGADEVEMDLKRNGNILIRIYANGEE